MMLGRTVVDGILGKEGKAMTGGYRKVQDLVAKMLTDKNRVAETPQMKNVGQMKNEEQKVEGTD